MRYAMTDVNLLGSGEKKWARSIHKLCETTLWPVLLRCDILMLAPGWEHVRSRETRYDPLRGVP
jgi:hypothetical protein